MIFGIFSLMGCDKDFELKQGVYTTDDQTATITLYGDNLSKLDIIYVDSLCTGSYSINSNKLFLNLDENYALIFQVRNNQLIFEGTNEDGKLLKEGPVKVGTVFEEKL
jgi:hypothetical protein